MNKKISNLNKIIFILISLLFITNVDAAGISNIKLTCPTVVTYNEEFTCSIKADITEASKIKEIKINEYKVEKPLEILEITTPVLNEGNNEISKIKIKAGETSSTSQLILKIEYKAGNISNFQTKYATAAMKVASDINTLKEIKIDNKKIENFIEENTNYELKTTKEKINISAIKTSNTSDITGTGEKKLSCGINNLKITVTAENKETKVYNITITRKCEETPYLKDIKVSEGNLSPNFDKKVTKYKVEVEGNIEKITIGATKENEKDIITGLGEKTLKYGSNKINIIVKNEKEKETKYVIEIIRKDTREKSSLLSSISLSSGDIIFDENIFKYETTVLYEITDIKILAISKEEDAKIEIKGNQSLKVGENTITIKVTSETKESSNYIIKVIRLNEGETLGNNPNIKDILIKGYKFEFKTDKKDYKLVIKDEDKLDIKVIMEDETGTYEIINNKNLKDNSVIKILTKSQDGKEETYTITVTKSNYVPLIIITIILIFLPMIFLVVTYFTSVKKKKENLDVNGYKIDKEGIEILTERKIISNDKTVNSDKK